ncbi:autotransporter outer membrane beta-barrel domain-containing protein [Methylophilaceae bacterium]|nr:autotransporter outer membrane beta-barrel domain-containing protein [Methylophilaceae bacterium]
MNKTIFQSIGTICLASPLFITSQVMAQDACVAGTGTMPSDGCFVSEVNDITYTLTSDTPIASPRGLTGIRIMDADRNTLSYTGDITSVALYTYGLFMSSSDNNTITITGDISTDGYGVITSHGNYNDITLNGNITTSKYLSYGAMLIAELNTNFTLNGNITTTAVDTPGMMLYNSSNMNVLINGNINVEGGGGSFGLDGRGIDVSGSSGSTITNLGTITTAGDDPYDIYLRDASTLATLNNRQAGLTYYGKIPTNYNAVINSTSDYGKIIFSTVSGTTSFGIYDGSVLQANTTYASVIDGLEASNITSGTSGDYSYDGRTWAWTLENSSANLWDLVVGGCIGCITLDTIDTIEEIGDSIGTEFSQLSHKGASATASFANMNTYDCDLFDQEGKCFSIGVRHTDINGNNNSDSSSSGAVAVSGYKFNENFRVSGFVDQQAARRNPKGLKVSNKGPMIGGNLVWNQFANHLGFQVRVANAYQAKDMTITRSEIGEAEKGRGETDIEVQSYVAEVSYQFSDGVNFYRPYLAARRSIIKQEGYTETEVANPLTFNTLEDKSTTVIIGMKVIYKLDDTVTLNGAFGVEHDVSNKVDKIQATSSTITGITPVDLNTRINKTRPVVTLGATYHISPNHTLSAQTQYQELSYTSTSAKTAYVNYTVGF